MNNLILVFKDYCEGCKVSEPEIETHILYGNNAVQERQHIVTCKHSDACYEMRKKMLKEMTDGSNVML